MVWILPYEKVWEERVMDSIGHSQNTIKGHSGKDTTLTPNKILSKK